MEFLAFGVFLSLFISVFSKIEINKLKKEIESLNDEVDLLEKDHLSLFEPRLVNQDNLLITLQRTNSHLGWYTSDEDLVKYKNPYFDLIISKDLVVTPVLKIRFKKDCLASFNTMANICKNGLNIGDEDRFKPNDSVSFYGNDLVCTVKITVFNVPHILK